jgi:hypothetical protein
VKHSTRRLDGVVIGVMMGLDEGGDPLVVFPGNVSDQAIPARTTVPLAAGDTGAELALLFEAGDPARPLVIGRLLRPVEETAEVALPAAAPREVRRDGKRVEIVAEDELVLRCGKASITLTRAGKVLIRGAYISSISTGANRIRGGSVQLN